jgi:hypothetical protein
MFNPHDHTYQINTHLLYELKWLIFAATEFKKGNTPYYVALIDSACIHGRNLFEFMAMNNRRSFTLLALDGTRHERRDWISFLSNRVVHMYGREGARPVWPDGLDNETPDRFIVMAQTLLNLLETNGQSIPAGPIKSAYDTLISAAKACLLDPSEKNFAALDALHDSGGDHRPY